jgi:ArsR family transcriptional regulator
MLADILFKSLADPTRLRAVVLVAEAGELCVCELTHALAVSQPKISRHLAQLRETGILRDRRDGLWIYYSLHPALPSWAREIVATTGRAVREQTPYADDRARLAQMADRPGAIRCA